MNDQISDKFNYQKGDLKFGKYQCDFCIFADKNDFDKCQKYDTKPTEVLQNKKRCDYLTTSNK